MILDEDRCLKSFRSVPRLLTAYLFVLPIELVEVRVLPVVSFELKLGLEFIVIVEQIYKPLSELRFDRVSILQWQSLPIPILAWLAQRPQVSQIIC